MHAFYKKDFSLFLSQLPEFSYLDVLNGYQRKLLFLRVVLALC